MDPSDPEKADMRIVQAAAQEVYTVNVPRNGTLYTCTIQLLVQFACTYTVPTLGAILHLTSSVL